MSKRSERRLRSGQMSSTGFALRGLLSSRRQPGGRVCPTDTGAAGVPAERCQCPSEVDSPVEGPHVLESAMVLGQKRYHPCGSYLDSSQLEPCESTQAAEATTEEETRKVLAQLTGKSHLTRTPPFPPFLLDQMPSPAC